jgi:succinate dehydrogenase / fumarate reductase cytochrome b subunit
MEQKQKPRFLNLLQIHLPVTGVASIAHRVSGALLFLSIPLLVYWFGQSLADAEGFDAVRRLFQHGAFQLLGVVLLWSLLHHLLAGVRFLLFDLHIGAGLPAARASAWLVNIGAVVLATIIIVGSWL